MGRTILFDLDGTLTDSGEGIINCATLALNHFGLPVPDRETMRVFVGPPLDETFMKFGVPADKTDEAIAVYRSRYVPIGKFENHPYPGVEHMLQQLCDNGHRLFVATSKPEDMSRELLEKFGLAQYFEQICGATLDGSRSKKEDVIAYLLDLTQGAEPMIMVGMIMP
jgi:phosphoglycolate phosphatase